jgi:hypothetical protein
MSLSDLTCKHWSDSLNACDRCHACNDADEPINTDCDSCFERCAQAAFERREICPEFAEACEDQGSYHYEGPRDPVMG